MSLYAIGDFHLSLSADKPMDIFGEKWKNHTEKLRQGFSELNSDDVTVICGDISWGMSLADCLEDFRFIDSLPGKKIILKGNHDYWWTTASKTNAFFRENGIGTIEVLHNNSIDYGETAICGTKGWFFEEETGSEHDKKILNREIGRLRTSLQCAGDKEKIVFLHYPPAYASYRCDEIVNVLNEFDVKLCCYGHLHGTGCYGAVTGWHGSTEYRLVSADYINFKPMKIL